MLSDDKLREVLIAEARRMAEQAGENPDSMTVDEDSLATLMLAGRAVERAAYERAAQECIETAAELRRCADGCTDGRYDWKADGALDCADAIRALRRQHD
jgi:hypothetical protein